MTRTAAPLRNFDAGEYLEVYVDTPLEVAQARDRRAGTEGRRRPVAEHDRCRAGLRAPAAPRRSPNGQDAVAVSAEKLARAVLGE